MAARILIVEDEALFASQVAIQIEKMDSEVVGITTNSTDTLTILGSKSVDLVIMDIHIKGEHDGIELSELISKQFNVPVVFMTSHQDDLTFNRAARSEPEAFLVKPFTDIQLRRTIELVLGKNKKQADVSGELEINSADRETLYIRKRSNIFRVPIADIYYLEANGRHTRIYTQDEFYLVRKVIKEMLAILPENKFIRCHRSYIVNMDKVKSVDLKDYLLILERKTVPLSKRQKDQLLERLKYI